MNRSHIQTIAWKFIHRNDILKEIENYVFNEIVIFFFVLTKDFPIPKILITGARSPASLDLARQLHSAGNKIYVADTSSWHICRFSNKVDKTFVVPSPRFFPLEFIDTLSSILQREGIDLLIPTCEEILTIAKYRYRFPKVCELFCSDFETIRTLHNKWLFIKKTESFGIPSPKTVLIENQSQIASLDFQKPWALKPCYSRASVRTQKITSPEAGEHLSFESFNPYIAQEWLEGKKFCSYSICRQGIVLAHATYPVEYAIDDCSCVSFRSIHHHGVLEWIQKFVKQSNFTGQIAFDFIETKDNLYAIECNPRATHGLLLFQNEDLLAKAFFEKDIPPILAKENSKKQIGMGMMMYGWKSEKAKSNRKEFIKYFFTTRDVVFHLKDLMPFFTMPLLSIRYLLLSWKLKISVPAAFTYDLDWNGEEMMNL